MNPPTAGSDSSPPLLIARRLFEAGHAAAAAKMAREIATRAGGAPEALMLWGIAAAEAGDLAGALAPLRRSSARSDAASPRGALIRVELGRALIALGHWREGLASLDQVDPGALGEPRLARRLGQGYLGAGLIAKALPHLRRYAQSFASDAEAHADLAWALAGMGQTESARDAYEQAIALAPAFSRAHAGLATVQRWENGDNHVPRLRSLLARAPGPAIRAEIGYALFKELDDLGEREEAWSALSSAHAAALELDPWSPNADTALVDALIQRFPVTLFRKRDRQAPPTHGPAPIFVMGLPRTGTTLVERILGAHSQVAGLGELPFFPIAFREAAGTSALAPLTHMVVRASRKAEWKGLGEAYLREAASLAGDVQHFVDKLPFNSHLAGAIRLALPQARLVLLERNPMDSLWSAHRHPFQIGGWYGWTRRQTDLAAHYANHVRLIAHWREALGDHLIVVRYEHLVADPQGAITALLDRCGLAAEPACFRPQEAAGPVLTLSQSSVRAPITANAVGAWRAYADKLEPLRRSLGDLGFAAA